MPETAIVVCGQVGLGVPSTADIEDLFDPADYLKLYNWAFGTAVSLAELPDTTEPILKRLGQIRDPFDHALPAHALTDHRAEFWPTIQSVTVDRFKALFALLNATLTAKE